MSAPHRFAIGLSEVALPVTEVARSVAFYTEVVGLEIDQRGDRWAYLWAGEPGVRQRVILLERGLPALGDRPRAEATPGPPVSLADLDPSRLGTTHFALEVRRREIGRAVQHVESSGHEVWGPVDLGSFGEAYYFLDPDGHWVELWSAPEAAEE